MRLQWVGPVGLRVLFLVASCVAPLSGQPRPVESTPARAEIEIRTAASAFPPQVTVRSVLSEAPFEALVQGGFPARLHVRAELWSTGRWFDDVSSRAEWDIIVRYDVVDRVYEVARFAGDRVTPLGSYARFPEARAAQELPFTPSLQPLRRGRTGYVLVQAELQVLDVSDLDELERWVTGEAAPALKGRRSPAGALSRGVRTLASRILGGEIRRLEARSPLLTF